MANSNGKMGGTAAGNGSNRNNRARRSMGMNDNPDTQYDTQQSDQQDTGATDTY